MTTAPLPTSHQAATAALSDLLGSAPIWSERDVDLARTLLLFGGAAAEAALLAWVEAQHAYPHALLAHLANTLPIIMMIVT